MFDAGEYEGRVASLRADMMARDIDVLLAVGVFPEKEGHVVYLTGHRLWSPLWPTGWRCRGAGYSFALLTRDSLEFFACTLDEAALAPTVARALAVNDVLGAVAQRVEELKPARVAVAGLDILPSTLHTALLQDGTPLLDGEALLFACRLHKSGQERRILEEGAQLGASAISFAQRSAIAGMTNGEVAGLVAGQALALGAEHVLRCRVRSGAEMRSVRWPYATGVEIGYGDCVQVDLVGLHRNYLFDISRVWCPGQPNAAAEEALAASSRSTRWLAEEMLPGRSLAASVAAWRARLAERAAGRIEIDGHSIGTDVVEPPWIFDDEALRVEAGMVFCLEPYVVLEDGAMFKTEHAVRIEREGAVIMDNQ